MLRNGERVARWVALAVGCLAIGSCCTAARASRVVLVSIAPSVGTAGRHESTPNTPTIHKGKNERLVWVSPPGSHLHQVSIASASGAPAPFGKCGSSMPCVIDCEPDGVCVSGPIRPDLPVPTAGLYYEYTPIFVALAAQADPGFIIKP